MNFSIMRALAGVDPQVTICVNKFLAYLYKSVVYLFKRGFRFADRAFDLPAKGIGARQ
jgi:hypothetical protein